MRRLLVHTGLLLGALSCAITDPCACPPGVSSFVLYGATPPAGSAGAKSPVVVRENPSPGCSDAAAPSLLLNDPVAIALDGSYRAALLSAYAPGLRCLTATFYEGSAHLSDSVMVTTAAVRFSEGPTPTDSLRVDLP